MLEAQPPQLLAVLGCPLQVIQSEIQKYEEMEKLKVANVLVAVK